MPAILAVQSEIDLSNIADKRTHVRFPIGMELQYKVVRGPSGSGRTLDISSGGLLFETAVDFPEDAVKNLEIELALKWPCLLNRECALKLMVRGHIVRRKQRQVAVKIRQYEFRTTGSRAAAV